MTIWVVVDPIGTIPVFIAVTSGMAATTRRWLAVRAVVVATLILAFFMAVGQILLEALRIPLTSFEVAGGLVLFLFALTMIFGPSKPEEEVTTSHPSKGDDVAIFPLAVPSIASPGAMLAVVVLTDNDRYQITEQLVTGMVMLSVMVILLALLMAAGPIHRMIGVAGASIVSRVMGLILASVAVDHVLTGLEAHFGYAAMVPAA